MYNYQLCSVSQFDDPHQDGGRGVEEPAGDAIRNERYLK